MKPDRLTPLIARHVDAIAIAKQEGVTWRQIAALFGGVGDDAIRAAFNRARKGLSCGRYVVQQLPLPEPAANTEPEVTKPETPEQTTKEEPLQKHVGFKHIKLD